MKRSSLCNLQPSASPQHHLATRAPGRLVVLLVCLCGLASACAPVAKTAEKQYMFWPPAPDAPHVQFLTSISSTHDVTGGQAQIEALVYGKDDSSDLPFARPYGVRMYNGCIYVCDATSANVSILDLRKKEVRILGKGGQVALLKPIDIAVTSDGVKYVADTGQGAILVYDVKDQYVGNIKIPKLRPVSIAVNGQELFVADMTASRIRVFDRFNGKELRSIGQPITADDKNGLGGVMGIALDSQGNIYANDVIGCRVRKFAPDGKILQAIGGLGDRPGHFVRPKLMTVDPDGILYVVDNAFQNVQMFNDKGQMLMFFGAAGNHPGAMNMPAGVCTSDTDLDLFQQYVNPAFQLQRLILVTNNAGRSRINIYGLGVLKPGKTLADLNVGRLGGVVGFDLRPDLSQGVPTALPADSDSSASPASQPATFPATAPASQPAKPKPEEPASF